MSGGLLEAWSDARDRFRGAGSGNVTEVRATLTQLGERLENSLGQSLAAQSKDLSPALAGPAAAKRQDVIQQAVDSVKASPSSAEFPDDVRSILETQFGEWVRASKVLESATLAFAQYQLDEALAKLDEFNDSGSDAALRTQADGLREGIKQAKHSESERRSAIQADIDDQHWVKAWEKVDALEKQTGGKETHLREGIVAGAVNAAKGDSGRWKVAIDLMAEFERVGDGDAAASLRGTTVADLLNEAGGSKANGDASTRQEALNLLSQLNRVSREDIRAADLRRQIEGKGYYEAAAASVNEGAFQVAADNYQKASELSYPGAEDRLGATRALAAADALLNNDKAAAEQLEAALKSLAPTPAYNPDEQAQADAAK